MLMVMIVEVIFMHMIMTFVVYGYEGTKIT